VSCFGCPASVPQLAELEDALSLYPSTR
jgi:hypothetical protein